MRHFLLTGTLALTGALAASLIATSSAGAAPRVAGEPSDILNHLGTLATIGSTVDPLNGDDNPYGLTIAPQAGGAINAGDLVVCNFDDALNIQGLGTSIVLLSPTVGRSRAT